MVSFARQYFSDFIVRHARPSELQQTRAQFFTACELGDRIDFHFDAEISHGAATPHDPRQSNVALTAVNDDFFDEAPQ
ncbi:hypothetical protein EV130_101398 [Rhizobium azibense]|uniref:Uncharacterized protein n=1 Tax=Rhizobium azibense TaxID=1136135 RepID=A0A4R3R6M9_9HYPH|nr:hypothetical protein [Rhizobium etli]TCU30823.1 hypothetical protein EV130_101398 [Rhizobium azibense]